jgi:hypothetical protein
MKHTKLNKLYILVALLFFISCNDYLDIEPRNIFVIKGIRHLDLLLNASETYYFASEMEMTKEREKESDNQSKYNLVSIGNRALFRYTADDYDNPYHSRIKESVLECMARWMDYNEIPDMKKENNYNKNMWGLSYSNMYLYNLILEKIDDVSLESEENNYTEKDRKRIKAEAKTCRAYEYWMLVNTYAKQYSKNTADTDSGVPLVTKADVRNKKKLYRASVQEIYDFIIKETSESIENLPQKQVNKIRPSKGCGYALLARFYLSMSNYEKALKNASLAINEKGVIASYIANDEPSFELERYLIREMAYYPKYTNVEEFLSVELASLFDKDDIRLTLNQNNWDIICSHFPCVPEMYLIRAECNARKGNIVDAIADLNALRKKRINNYENLTTDKFNDKDELLKFVLEERRRELYRFDLRLFDLKRLNLEPAFAKSVTHVVRGMSYTIKPGSPNLVIPIPANILDFNPDMKQNPRGEVIVKKAKKIE